MKKLSMRGLIFVAVVLMIQTTNVAVAMWETIEEKRQLDEDFIQLMQKLSQQIGVKTSFDALGRYFKDIGKLKNVILLNNKFRLKLLSQNLDLETSSIQLCYQLVTPNGIFQNEQDSIFINLQLICDGTTEIIVLNLKIRAKYFSSIDGGSWVRVKMEFPEIRTLMDIPIFWDLAAIISMLIKRLKVSDDEVCKLCMKNFEKNAYPIITDCLHVFHFTCYYKLDDAEKACPICRQQVNTFICWTFAEPMPYFSNVPRPQKFVKK